MSRICKSLVLFGIGGIIYIIIELLWRGYTHFSMFILGGLCFRLIGELNEHAFKKSPLIFQMALGMVIITSLEFIFGYVLNIKLGLNIWDYSDLPLNIMGQVCLPYALMWFLMSGICVVFDDWIRANME